MRGRPRTPLAKLQANGAIDNDPKRYKDRKEPASQPLGKPSRTLSKREVEAWEAFKREASWLMECDRALVEVACQCRARVWAGKATDKDIDRLLGGSSTLAEGRSVFGHCCRCSGPFLARNCRLPSE